MQRVALVAGTAEATAHNFRMAPLQRDLPATTGTSALIAFTVSFIITMLIVVSVTFHSLLRALSTTYCP
eukprot:6138193-Amphidinium_carterae.1